MDPNLLSILVPLYNEEEFVGALLERVCDASLPGGLCREVIVVDDGSTDSSVELVEVAAQTRREIRLIRHARNQGKGAAVRTALDNAKGEYCIIQDADLEYNPCEFGKMLKPLLDGRADAVYGSRFVVAGERRVLYFWHALANWMLTNACNIVSDLNLTDMETCYKVFRIDIIRGMRLRSNRFGIEPEITAKVARARARIYEVPISYAGRSYTEGKKIGWKDGIAAVWTIIKYWLIDDR